MMAKTLKKRNNKLKSTQKNKNKLSHNQPEHEMNKGVVMSDIVALVRWATSHKTVSPYLFTFGVYSIIAALMVVCTCVCSFLVRMIAGASVARLFIFPTLLSFLVLIIVLYKFMRIATEEA